MSECEFSKFDSKDFVTRRDYFAAAAMQGMLTRGVFGMGDYDKCVEWAVKHADALIKALEGER